MVMVGNSVLWQDLGGCDLDQELQAVRSLKGRARAICSDICALQKLQLQHPRSG